jgi:endo-cleaving rubber dioxygenase
MEGFTRRKMLIVSGGALGALGALGTAAPAQAQADPRWVWDPEADPVVASILDRGQVPEVNRLLATWTRNDQPLPAGLPEELRAFIEQARRLPPWADQSKLDGAAGFTQTKGTYLILLYGLGGGMLSCAIPNEARAVYYSKGGADLKDRAAKTGKLGYDIQEPNAYRPDGHMQVTAVKTRLVHAAVRHLLPQSPYWKQGIPISQNDMLVTWHTLPTFVMRKLTEWRVRITPAESEAFLHLWQVTAHMLGIRDEYIPSSWAAANAQSKQVLDPAMGRTREGVDLADQILDISAKGITPGGSTRPLLNALARHLVGDQVSDWAAIAREPVWGPLVRTGFPAWVALRENLTPLPLVPQIAWTLDEAVRRYILFYLSGGKQITIEIPDTNRPS